VALGFKIKNFFFVGHFFAQTRIRTVNMNVVNGSRLMPSFQQGPFDAHRFSCERKVSVRKLCGRNRASCVLEKWRNNHRTVCLRGDLEITGVVARTRPQQGQGQSGLKTSGILSSQMVSNRTDRWSECKGVSPTSGGFCVFSAFGICFRTIAYAPIIDHIRN